MSDTTSDLPEGGAFDRPASTFRNWVTPDGGPGPSGRPAAQGSGLGLLHGRLAGAGLVPIFAATIPSGLIALAATVALVRGRVPVRPTLRLNDLVLRAPGMLALLFVGSLGLTWLAFRAVPSSFVEPSAGTGRFPGDQSHLVDARPCKTPTAASSS